jgi:hypothetical protein
VNTRDSRMRAGLILVALAGFDADSHAGRLTELSVSRASTRSSSMWVMHGVCAYPHPPTHTHTRRCWAGHGKR